MKKLVAYFSCTGMTRRVAELLTQAVDADIYEIRPREPYTAADIDWTDKTSRSTVEMKNPDFRPPIQGRLENMDEYDVVFLGFPIWWYVAPTIINTFLESYDFSGKTIVPFATSGGSGMGETERLLREAYPNAVWKKGKVLNGKPTVGSLKTWTEELGVR